MNPTDVENTLKDMSKMTIQLINGSTNPTREEAFEMHSETENMIQLPTTDKGKFYKSKEQRQVILEEAKELAVAQDKDKGITVCDQSISAELGEKLRDQESGNILCQENIEVDLKNTDIVNKCSSFSENEKHVISGEHSEEGLANEENSQTNSWAVTSIDEDILKLMAVRVKDPSECILESDNLGDVDWLELIDQW